MYRARSNGAWGGPSKTEIVVKAIFMAIVVACILGFGSGWALMIAIGIVHAEVLTAVKPAGYWVSYVLSVLSVWAFSLRGSVD